MNQLAHPAALKTLTSCFALQKGDQFLFISDGQKQTLETAFREACKQLELSFSAYVLEAEDSYEPPSYLEALLNQATAALIATRRSYTHSDAVRQARAKGLRVATSPGISEAKLITGLAADYAHIARSARLLASQLEQASHVKVSSPSGTELSFKIAQQKGFAETGLYTSPGNVGNLPAGEASCGVDEGTAEGQIVVNGSYPKLGKLASPLLLTVKKGRIVDVSGEQAQAFLSSLDEQALEARDLAELGIGLNSSFGLTGDTLLDEKVAGTLHFGFGNNVSFGGSNAVPYHADAVVTDADLYLDAKQIQIKDFS